MRVLITGGNGDMAQAVKTVLSKVSDYELYTPDRSELDVANIESVVAYMQKVKPQVLINCAGYINPNKIVDSDDQDWDRHFKVNIYGSYLCSKYAIKQGCFFIINVGSTSALEGREGWGAYCASKAGIMSLTETISREGTPCYAIHPARTKTKMRKRLFPKEDESSLMDPQRVGDFVLKCLKGKFATGSHIIVKKFHSYVLPMRECPK